MAKYEVLSGECYKVEASNEEEALAKFFAYHNAETCPCGVEECDCVDWSETLTEVI
jgi:hypothetical protein